MKNRWSRELPASLQALSGYGWCAEEVDAVVVSGEDAPSYLQGQVSQDLSALRDGDTTWSFLLEPDGKLGWLLRVHRVDANRFELLGASDTAAAIESRLNRFRIRVKVDVRVEHRRLLSLGTDRTWPESGSRFDHLTPFGGPRQVLLSDDPSGILDEPCDAAIAASSALWSWRVSSADAREGMIPGELGQATIESAVSFSKGCYTGQELVARLDARSAPPPRLLCALASAEPIEGGGSICLGAEEIGTVGRVAFDAETSTAHGFALIKRRFLAELASEAHVDGLAVELRALEALTSEG